MNTTATTDLSDREPGIPAPTPPAPALLSDAEASLLTRFLRRTRAVSEAVTSNGTYLVL